jgi:hypothetical protein
MSAMIPIGTSRLNQSKIMMHTAWMCRNAPKIDSPVCCSVSTMPMPKMIANTSTRTLSFNDSAENMFVGMTEKIPGSGPEVLGGMRFGSMANSTSMLSAERPTSAPIFATTRSSAGR